MLTGVMITEVALWMGFVLIGIPIGAAVLVASTGCFATAMLTGFSIAHMTTGFNPASKIKDFSASDEYFDALYFLSLLGWAVYNVVHLIATMCLTYSQWEEREGIAMFSWLVVRNAFRILGWEVQVEVALIGIVLAGCLLWRRAQGALVGLSPKPGLQPITAPETNRLAWCVVAAGDQHPTPMRRDAVSESGALLSEKPEGVQEV